MNLGEAGARALAENLSVQGAISGIFECVCGNQIRESVRIELKRLSAVKVLKCFMSLSLHLA